MHLASQWTWPRDDAARAQENRTERNDSERDLPGRNTGIREHVGRRRTHPTDDELLVEEEHDVCGATRETGREAGLQVVHGGEQ